MVDRVHRPQDKGGNGPIPTFVEPTSRVLHQRDGRRHHMHRAVRNKGRAISHSRTTRNARRPPGARVPCGEPLGEVPVDQSSTAVTSRLIRLEVMRRRSIRSNKPRTKAQLSYTKMKRDNSEQLTVNQTSSASGISLATNSVVVGKRGNCRNPRNSTPNSIKTRVKDS